MPNYSKPLTANIASGNLDSSAVKIEGHQGLGLELPVFTSGLNTALARVSLKGSETLTGTYRPIYTDRTASSQWAIPTGTGNVYVAMGPESFNLPKFLKVCVDGTNATATAAGYDAVVHMFI